MSNGGSAHGIDPRFTLGKNRAAPTLPLQSQRVIRPFKVRGRIGDRFAAQMRISTRRKRHLMTKPRDEVLER
jgi:hypothetical protein